MKNNIKQISPSQLRTQQDILDSWIDCNGTPLVSINCITYNHENYIEDAIIGFLKQETDFPFEILINDDASTDNTPDIIRKYESLYPAIIKVIYHTENKHSKGFNPLHFNLDRSEGYYTAICEGDDYWLSTTHLKDAISAFKKNPNISIYGSACYISMLNLNRTIVCDSSIKAYNLNSYIIESPFIATCSLVMKTSIYRDIQKIPVLGGRYFAEDTRLKLISLTKGTMLVDQNPSVVYRKGTIGSWSNRKITKEILLKELLDNLAITREVGYLCSFEEVEALMSRVESEYLDKSLRISALKGNKYWLRHLFRYPTLLSKNRIKSSIAISPVLNKHRILISKLVYTLKKNILKQDN